MVEKFDPNTWTGKVEVDGQEIELALVDEESAEGEIVPEAATELELEPLPDGMYDVEPREETVIEPEQISEDLTEEIAAPENTNAPEEVNEKIAAFSEQEIDELLDFVPSKSEEIVEKNVKQTPEELIDEIMNSPKSLANRQIEMSREPSLRNHPIIKAIGNLDKQMDGKKTLNENLSFDNDDVKNPLVAGLGVTGLAGAGALIAGSALAGPILAMGISTVGLLVAGGYGIKKIGNMWYGRKIRKANERMSELGYPITK